MDTTVASQFVGEGPPRPGEDRKISGGPLYAAGDVLDLLDLGNPVLVLWTQRGQEDVCKLVRAAVASPHQFHGSEWCLQGANGPWAACDAYLVGRKKLPRAIAKIGMSFYVKFAIARMNRKLWLVSCHPSEDRRKER